jgi:hypothetical protein
MTWLIGLQVVSALLAFAVAIFWFLSARVDIPTSIQHIDFGTQDGSNGMVRRGVVGLFSEHQFEGNGPDRPFLLESPNVSDTGFDAAGQCVGRHKATIRWNKINSFIPAQFCVSLIQILSRCIVILGAGLTIVVSLRRRPIPKFDVF